MGTGNTKIRTLAIASVGEDMEQPEPLYQYTTCKNSNCTTIVMD